MTTRTVGMRSARRHRPTPSATAKAANASASDPARFGVENFRAVTSAVAPAETSTSVRAMPRSAAVGASPPPGSDATAKSLPQRG